jgi:hypothetical protein
MFGESYRTQELVNANRQEGQGILVFTFLIAAALITQIPAVKRVLDPVRANVKSYAMSQFDSAGQQSKGKTDCSIYSLSYSSPVGCTHDKK